MSVEVYSVGMCYASACAPKDTPAEEVEQAANFRAPTGLDHGWKLSDDDTFAGGEANPCPCPDRPGNMHWLLAC